MRCAIINSLSIELKHIQMSAFSLHFMMTFRLSFTFLFIFTKKLIHIFRFIFDHPRISYSQIFELVKSEDDSVLEMEYQIGIDNPEKIQIIAGAKIHNIISENRLTVWGKTLNLSSVFSQCIVEAIHLIRQNPGEHEYKKWYKVLDQSVANCGFGSGLDDSSLEILRTAQKLFSNPYYEADHTIKELLDEQ